MTENEQYKNQLGQIGERLKKARQARKLEREEIAARLRLSAQHVQALERGDEQPFGASIYVRGYLANYARQVGLNPKKLLAGLEQSASQPPLQVAAVAPPSHRLAEGVARWSTYLVGTAVVVLPILWWASEDSLDALLGPSDSGPGIVAEQATEPLAATVQSGDAGQAAGQPVLASMTPIRPLKQSAVGPPAPAADTGEGARSADALDEPIVPLLVPTPPEATPQLTLELQADSWVEVRDASGERLEYDLLRAGTTHRYRGVPPFQVLLGNATGVTVRYNKQPFDFSEHVQGNLARFAVGEKPGRG